MGKRDPADGQQPCSSAGEPPIARCNHPEKEFAMRYLVASLVILGIVIVIWMSAT